jgi:hypothetical protein
MVDDRLIEDLLLACLRVDDSATLVERLSPASAADWLALLELAERQRVGALLAARLAQAGLEAPQAGRGRLRAMAQIGALEAARERQALGQLLAALGGEGIPVIVLKGGYLAEAVYPPGARGMTDIDLLAPVDDLERAGAVLQGLGYTWRYRYPVERQRKVLHSLPPLEKRGDYAIDLHWTLAPPWAPFHLPLDELWRRACPVRLAGQAALALAREDLLLHLCLHAAYMEAFSSGLRPLGDIAWVIERFRGEVDWDVLAGRAAAWGAGRCAWLALSTAAELLGARIPAEALAALRPADADEALVTWAAAQVLNPSEMGGKLAAVWGPNPWRVRVGLFMRQLFPAGYEMRESYPRLARGLGWPLAYLRHLGVVVARNGRAAWRLARGEAAARGEAERRRRASEVVRWLGEG